MDSLQAIILALLQGLTEFLPISSSGHLILPSAVLGWPDQGLAFDVAVHVGSLLAIVWFFRKDVLSIALGSLESVQNRQWNPESQTLLFLVIATIPAGLAALTFNDLIESELRSPLVIASTTLCFGLLLGVADKFGSREKSLLKMTLWAAFIIGCAQAIALIPGTSRSGITMTAALLLGFQRDAAARFSFLMSIPIIVLSGAYKGLELVSGATPQWDLIAIGVVVSAISAYACVYWFMAVIERMGMLPFVLYRIVLAAILFALFV
ncbi:undecaprenyl-diphosphate phosphatase [Pseudoteredinibacter isoporae]|uniref:Undecaprenyl-diphosphatase n=1 Tax=Pseudoteredinibacter isoporae TaxID=570281 RepID=A0A7X0N001_9GAMM|nr:undecaprenyl-diphosphate phosphatase [Pseudoteredinibacter isoporae]MBB6523727.1 undecaprenyl-diphosphatase [Pseudoteredinibacter isoporae]NHO89229.1 undecaprenyl-diphosphate phosphatase [Pseudoteredinibacter isoporae]NIB22160.1 undecaprenyl-diphosphate phosphatase [Pseudoteredinibacter isoporae]